MARGCLICLCLDGLSYTHALRKESKDTPTLDSGKTWIVKYYTDDYICNLTKEVCGSGSAIEVLRPYRLQTTYLEQSILNRAAKTGFGYDP